MKMNERIIPIDRYRGIIVFCMIFFQYLERFNCFGWFGRVSIHNPSEGILLLNNFTLADIGAPIFYFIIALNFVPSFLSHKEKESTKAAYIHIIKRGLSIMGFGCCLVTIDDIFYGEDWFYLRIALVMTILCILFGIFKLLTLCIKKLRSKGQLASKLFSSTLLIMGASNVINELICLIPLIQGKQFYGSWGVLQAIGFAELISLTVASLSTVKRGIAGILLLALYTWIHEMPGYMEIIDVEVQGGVIGAFGWASMLILFTVFADLYYQDRDDWKQGKHNYRYLVAIIASSIIAFIGYQFFYVNKGSVSPGFILVSIPISSALFLVAIAMGEKKRKFSIMVWWGESPILMFLLQYLFVNIPISLIPSANEWGLLPASIYGVGLIALITLIAYSLDKQSKRIRF